MQSTIWRDEDWIGQGLSYASFADNSLVKFQRESVLQIPAQFEQEWPHPNLSIRALLSRIERVTQGRVAKIYMGKDLISPREPNTSLEELFSHTILPQKEVLDEMNRAFGQKWFNGEAKSIIDFTSLEEGMEVRYPLPALEIYRQFNRANMVRTEWRRVQSWMDKGKRSVELDAAVSLTKRLLSVLEWDCELRALETMSTTASLLKILNDGVEGWLSDDHIDMLMQILTDRLETKQDEPDIILASTFFQHFVERAYRERNAPNPRNEPLLLSFCGEFLTGRMRALYFIGNVNGNHWVVWKIDYHTATLHHGMYSL
ncbi:hypothetical protein ACEPAI_8346 [Sanghuangporus weigelae]